MGAPAASHPLIDEAEAALRRLADAPLGASEAGAAATRLASHRDRTPLVVGVGGDDLAARTALLDALCGGGLLDPAARISGCAALRLRAGAVTRFAAVLRAGTTEEATLPDDGEARARAAALRDRLAEREAALAALPPPPRPRWSLWRWLRRLFGRGDAPPALPAAATEITALTAELAAAEADGDAVRASFVDRLRELCSGDRGGAGVTEVTLELAGGRLPDGVEALELAGWSRAGAEVDAVIAAPGDLDELADLLARGRAVAIARDAVAALTRITRLLEDEVERVEAELRSRLDRLEAMRVAEPSAFIAAQLQRVRPHLVPSVNAVIEHASVHLGAELAQLGAEWAGAIGKAATADELKAAATGIEESAPASAQRIAAEVRTLVMGGAGGAAYDMVPELIAPLRDQGLPPDDPKVRRKAPVLARVEVLPSLAAQDARTLGESGNWLTKLFRSLDTRRNEVLDNVKHRATRMSEVAGAELLDAEPRLHAAITDALTAELTAALDRQQAWLDAAVAAERDAIAVEREALAPLTTALASAQRDARALSSRIAALAG